MDTDAVYGPTQDDKVKRNAYFMFCFDDFDYPCVYTPNIFQCNWINWDSDLSVWDEFKNSNENWGLSSNVCESSNTASCSDVWDSEETCNNGKWTDSASVEHDYVDVGKALFGSMVCQWAGGSASECGYTVGADTIVYKSKGIDAGVKLHTSDRYEQRYCSELDTD